MFLNKFAQQLKYTIIIVNFFVKKYANIAKKAKKLNDH